MKVIDTDFIREMEYVFIFEYFDQPLAFISSNNNKYYFLYTMDDNLYFIKRLDRDNIDLIFSDSSIGDILYEFKESGDLKVLIIENEQSRIFSIEEYEFSFSDSIVEYIPTEDVFFEYDYLRNESLQEISANYKEYFPDYFNITRILYKLIDRENSHIMSARNVSKMIDYVQKFIKQKKEELEELGIITDQDLNIVPFTEGSFEINFLIDERGQQTLFEESLVFDNLVDLFYGFENYNANYLFDHYINEHKEFYNKTKDLINYLNDQDLNVELLDSRNNKVGAINPVDTTINKIKLIDNLIVEQEKLKLVSNVNKFVGEVRSASNERNYLKLRLPDGNNIKAKFTKELFKEIKQSVKSVTVSSSISGELNIEHYFNDKDELVKEKYIITSFEQ
ncbi:hypothetical protein ACFP65_07955 [Marinilactibacillus sp. GCM10026970]|uniref:hypothetical protein n=1 Tax=Marinilactibacillus sp. GCM10026970 TaxID=3252642 RepID=UPI003617CF67